MTSTTNTSKRKKAILILILFAVFIFLIFAPMVFPLLKPVGYVSIWLMAGLMSYVQLKAAHSKHRKEQQEQPRHLVSKDPDRWKRTLGTVGVVIVLICLVLTVSLNAHLDDVMSAVIGGELSENVIETWLMPGVAVFGAILAVGVCWIALKVDDCYLLLRIILLLIGLGFLSIMLAFLLPGTEEVYNSLNFRVGGIVLSSGAFALAIYSVLSGFKMIFKFVRDGARALNAYFEKRQAGKR